jgi:hypothetical protein
MAAGVLTSRKKPAVLHKQAQIRHKSECELSADPTQNRRNSRASCYGLLRHKGMPLLAE